MIEVNEVVFRWRQGMGIRKIAQSLSLSRNTVRKILVQAQQSGICKTSQEEEIVRMMDSLADLRQPPTIRGQATAYFASQHTQIEAWLGQPYMTIAQMVRLLEEQGGNACASSLGRYIKKHFASLPVSTVHLTTKPGAQAQVDFAYVGLMKDPLSQKMKKAYTFIIVLSYSRYRFVRFVFRQDVKAWIDCHIRAFHFFGGVPAVVMPDNLKAGVQTPDLYDPVINFAYGELEKHYGFICDPTKIRTPAHKGKVERSVQLSSTYERVYYGSALVSPPVGSAPSGYYQQLFGPQISADGKIVFWSEYGSPGSLSVDYNDVDGRLAVCVSTSIIIDPPPKQSN